MKRLRFAAVSVIALALLLAPVCTLAAAQKIKAYKGQAGRTFVNTEPVPADGLHVTLSGKGDVVTDNATGAAGPFRNVRGNDTNHVIMTNPKDPIAGEGEGKVELMFRTYQKKLEITGWWWVDQNGKRIGKKQKP